jgi:2-iminobutanoate/2-iminopropanoate deaminase
LTVLKRTSFDVPGLGHGNNPVPVAARVGSLIATGGIRGIDRETGRMPEDVAGQAEHMFANLVAAVQIAGGSVDTILKVTVHLRSADGRALINPAWQRHFPDADARPSRQVIIYEHLGANVLVQCDALAVALPRAETPP